MDQNSNALNWFEIPVADINRAKKFYEGIFATELQPVMEMMGYQMSFFPAPQDKVGGSLVQHESVKPSMEGAAIYLNANPSINAVVGRIESNGGQVLMPPMQISPEIGYMAFFVDSEGNKMALHANNQ
jgi:predicted enzyme related to lactoylglutathione lyase